MADRREVRHWPVVAWIRLRVPPPPAPMMLTRGPPPPPLPPADWLENEGVPTDPSVTLYSFLEPHGDGAIRYVWAGASPELLLAEYRIPGYLARLPPGEVRRFWAAVKARLGELGPLPVDGADPRP